jgi:MFS family permease
MGLLLATFVTDLFTRQITSIADNPSLAWRLVFLSGLLPAVAAAGIRLTVKEPAMWRPHEAKPRLSELFSPQLRRRTVGGLVIAVLMLLTWWTSNSFLPRIASVLAVNAGLPQEQSRYVTIGTYAFNLGGLVGALLTVPIAIILGRRLLFVLYFAGSAAAIFTVFGFEFSPETRLRLMFLVGIGVYGAFGALPFYLPELFPTRLRGTGSGFCYNFGRFIAAAGPFAVPMLAKWLETDLRHIVTWAAAFPLAGIILILAGLGHETRDTELERT